MKSKTKKKLIVAGGILSIIILLFFVGGSETQLQHKIKIEESPDIVFSLLSNLESVQDYIPQIHKAKYLTEQKTGVGCARSCDFGENGGIVHERVTDYKEGEYISMEMYKYNLPLEYMNWKTSLKSEGEITEVTQITRYKVKYGFWGNLLDGFMVKNNLQSTLNYVFNSMKDYAENVYVAPNS